MMNGYVNGNDILFSKSVLFREGDQVTFPGNFPVKFSTDGEETSDIKMSWDGTWFELSLRGLTPDVHDRVAVGNGHWQGKDFKWLARGQRVAETTPPMYGVELTVFNT